MFQRRSKHNEERIEPVFGEPQPMAQWPLTADPSMTRANVERQIAEQQTIETRHRVNAALGFMAIVCCFVPLTLPIALIFIVLLFVRFWI